IDVEVLKGELRSIAAGESLQAVMDVTDAYVVCLKARYPNKVAHIRAIAAEYNRMSSRASVQSALTSPEGFDGLESYAKERANEALPELDSIPVEQRLTEQEITAALGKPNYQSRVETIKSLSV